MIPRRALLAAVLGLLSACGGAWSTQDLEFISALPTRGALAVRLPAVMASAQPLQGSSTRRDGLNVGDPSPAWAATQQAAADMNALLDAVLGGLDVAHSASPTTRTRDALTWGPYPDAKTPGLEFQVVMRRTEPARFTWALQARSAGGAFFDAMTGDFTAQGSTRQGAGALSVNVAALRSVVPIAPVLQSLDRLDVTYQTAARPFRVSLTFTPAAGATSSLSPTGYVARSLADGRGALTFQAPRAPPEAASAAMEIRWTSRGAGRAEAVVTQGTSAGAALTECWDSSARVLFIDEPWPGGRQAGARADCLTVDGL